MHRQLKRELVNWKTGQINYSEGQGSKEMEITRVVKKHLKLGKNANVHVIMITEKEDREYWWEEKFFKRMSMYPTNT